jgi:hypothetical protein
MSALLTAAMLQGRYCAPQFPFKHSQGSYLQLCCTTHVRQQLGTAPCRFEPTCTSRCCRHGSTSPAGHTPDSCGLSPSRSTSRCGSCTNCAGKLPAMPVDDMNRPTTACGGVLLLAFAGCGLGSSCSSWSAVAQHSTPGQLQHITWHRYRFGYCMVLLHKSV